MPSGQQLQARGWPTVRRWAVALGGALVVTASACGDGDGGGATVAGVQSPVVVVATTSIWADVMSNIACDGEIDVQTIIPTGGDPHGFEPSLADRSRMEDAALVVANGLFLEEGLEDTLDAVAGAGTPVIRVGEHIETIEYGFDADHDEDEGDEEDHAENDHEGDDPHFWFDPVRVTAALPELGEQLVSHAGVSPAAIEKCVDDYSDQLMAVSAEIAEMVATVPEERRKLVTSHDSLGYFADRYGFEVIGTVIPVPSGLAETNPAQLEALAEIIEQAGVPAIFAETQHSDDDARALADRVGDVDVVTLFTGTLGDPDRGADTYIGFLLTNAELITSALR